MPAKKKEMFLFFFVYYNLRHRCMDEWKKKQAMNINIDLGGLGLAIAHPPFPPIDLFD